MPKIIEIDFDLAKTLIEEGDILLFHGSSWSSYFIGCAGETNYSHVGLCSFVNGDSTNPILELVHFDERAGGGAVNLQVINETDDRLIDVYRANSYKQSIRYNKSTNNFEEFSTILQKREITKNLRKLSGLPYGWRRIWWIAKYKMAGFRLFMNKEKLMDDTFKQIIWPICSSSVAFAYSKAGYDLTPNRADEFMEPSHIARSSLINYLFTIKKP